MKKFLTAIALILGFTVSAQREAGTPQERYIARYASIAVNEMYRSGVPASITLAQGIIESRSGQSALAAEGNNHFGIHQVPQQLERPLNAGRRRQQGRMLPGV